MANYYSRINCPVMEVHFLKFYPSTSALFNLVALKPAPLSM